MASVTHAAVLQELQKPEALALVVTCALVGVLTLAKVTFAALGASYRLFLRQGKSLRRYGEWAVVTGCTDGIGKATAVELAKKKFKLVLIGRSPDKLAELGAELSSFNTETKVIVADLAAADDKTYDSIGTQLAPLDVGMLWCCAGLSYPHAKFFHETDAALCDDLLNVNCVAPTRLAACVLPGMIERKRGAIIITGSGAGTVLPSDPLYAVYAGTKAYVEKFAHALNVEYAGKGIDVQLQAPLFVATKMAKIRKPRLDAPSPKVYAKASLACVGYDAVCTPYWVHSLMWGAVAMLPVGLANSIRLGQSLGIRKRALKKLAAKAAEGKKQ